MLASAGQSRRVAGFHAGHARGARQGALQTDVNVSLPWAKTVTLNPGVTLSSVTATSVTGQLNCSISDGTGAAVAAQNNNTLITTCTR